MAKFSGDVKPLLDLREPFAIYKKGKIYNLSSSLVLQQSVLFPSTSQDSGTVFTTGTGTSVAFNPGSVSFSTVPQGLLCGTVSTKFGLPSKIADCLSFTSKELTLSIWVSGSLHSTKIGDLHEKSVIQSSGSEGVQFMIGNFDTSITATSSHFIAAVYNDGVSNDTMNVVASTHKTVGRTGPTVLGNNFVMGYKGRYVQVINPLSSNSNPVNMSKSGWHHIVYVQKAATNPVVPETQFLFGKGTSPLINLSKTGDEGRCEMWFDGELVYTTPQYGPFPEGHSPYFYEDGLEGLNGSTKSRFLESRPDSTLTNSTTTQNKILRQQSPQAFLSGSSANGDATAQLAVWRKALSRDEITAIYKGTIQGIYSEEITSFSASPKRLIENGTDSQILTSKNVGFQDAQIKNSFSPFSDISSNTENLNKQYQENFYFSPFGQSTPQSLIEKVLGDKSASTKNSIGQSAFEEAVDKTNERTERLDTASGSVSIRISIPNTDPNIAAGRSHNSGTVDTFNSQVGLDATGSMCIGTGFLYYSPTLKRWVEKRADASTSFTSERSLLTNNASASNYILQLSSSRGTDFDKYGRRSMVKTGGTLSQFSWSPQFGYFFNHVEHLQQVGYSRIGWPTSFFGAPNAPKYHGHDHETIKLSDFIDRPFLLKRIEIKVPVRSERYFGANPNYNNGDDSYNQQITNKKDIDNYVFFVYRQRRVSRDKDSWLDRGTSKRYLIASASVCYYNSASFGGAFKDGFFNQSKWATATALSGALSQPGDQIDYFSQSLTQISGNNPILHNPQYLKEWGIDRFVGAYQTTTLEADSTTLNLVMFPSVVPDCQVSPSLMPFTSSFANLDVSAFSQREGGDALGGGIDYITGGIYVTSGTRSYVNVDSPAPFLSLVSHRWFGGTRPPQIASSETADPYDTVRVPSNNDNDTKVRGSVDTNIHNTANYVDDVRLELDDEGFTRYGVRLSRGSFQSQGVSLIPLAEKRPADPNRFMTQISIDPQSFTSPIPAGVKVNSSLRGRLTNFNDPNAFTTSYENTYGGYYGWRFISSFQIGDFSEQQSYSPTILDPHDELILGLDAGTFGPPDLDTDDLVADNAGPTTGTSATGLDESGTKRLFKNTHLKEDYRSTLPHSRLKILTGEAEIILIGEFLSDKSPLYVGRSSPQGNGISQIIGNDPVVDKSFLFNLDLLSGSSFTRVFTGSEGPQGLIDGNSAPNSARRFFKDAGTRRDI